MPELNATWSDSAVQRGERERMVADQIAGRGIRDEGVLAAMRTVPRHLFVSPEHAGAAYEDRPLPIGDAQTISQPYMVAVMTEVLAVRPADQVLEIGTGSGYQAAVLARLARRVVTIERHPALATAARQRLAALGLDNVEVREGDGTDGAPDQAPFDRILVTAGTPRIPDALLDQLADDGRLVAPVGPPGLQYLTVVTRRGGELVTQTGDPCAFVPLVGRFGWTPE